MIQPDRRYPSAADEAIARCDAILANIDRIQRDLRESTARTKLALDEAIAKIKGLG